MPTSLRVHNSITYLILHQTIKISHAFPGYRYGNLDLVKVRDNTVVGFLWLLATDALGCNATLQSGYLG